MVYQKGDDKSDPEERDVSVKKGRVINGDLTKDEHSDIINLPSGNMVFLPPGSVEEVAEVTS